MKSKKKKYSIVLFLNKKKIKTLYKCNNKNNIYEKWKEYRKVDKPKFPQLQVSKRKQEANYELGLIFPMTRWVKEDRFYVRDSLGRLTEALLDDNEFRIKELVKYWVEELVYDFETKKRITYDELLEQMMEVKEISQIYTLNNKLFLQTDLNIKMFGNKNIDDCQRLLELLRTDLLREKKGNFIFIKDLTTQQRKYLYDFLERNGFKRTKLFKHYSY